MPPSPLPAPPRPWQRPLAGGWARAAWPALGLALAATGCAALLTGDLNARRAAFDTDARIAHRLLSQQAVQVDAMLAMLTLLQPGADGPEAAPLAPAPAPFPAAAGSSAAGSAPVPAAVPAAGGREQRLPALAPQVLQVLRRSGAGAWPGPAAAALARAETESARSGRPVLGPVDLARGHYTVLRAGHPASYALLIDAARSVPWAEWPLTRAGPARAWLEHEGQVWHIQPGASARTTTLGPWRLQARKRLASDSQPLDLVVALDLPPGQLPWGWLAGWCVLSAGLALAGRAWQRQRDQAQRSLALLRLGQVGRLNAMGELAAGMAHELNQPLTAVLASTQAAQRLLDEHLAAQRPLDEHLAAQPPLDEHLAAQRLPAEPLPAPEAGPAPELITARQALAHSAQQARRAADVVARLRRLVQPVDPALHTRNVTLADAVRGVLYLLAPQIAQLGVQVDCSRVPEGLQVRADPVALEQILHNLVLNALQALEPSTAGARRLAFSADPPPPAPAGAQPASDTVRLCLRDSGPGFAPGALARAFEPFFTTRAEGLGLGLSLCESLAASQGGSLQARNAAGGGAELTLCLPAATPAPAGPT